MTTEKFTLALGIIAQHHSTKVIINKVSVIGYLPKGRTIHIQDCVPAVINKLKANDFILRMSNGLLEVYSIQQDTATHQGGDS